MGGRPRGLVLLCIGSGKLTLRIGLLILVHCCYCVVVIETEIHYFACLVINTDCNLLAKT